MISWYTRIISHQSKASTLLYVIFVSLVISLLLSSLILVEYNNFSEADYYKKYSEAIDKLDLYKSVFLSRYFNHEIEEYSNLPLGENINTADVQIKYLNWGLFHVGVCKYHDKDNRINLCKQYLLGNLIDKSCALYIADNLKSVTISGTTKIKGNVFIPAGYYKTGVINSRDPLSVSPVEGNIKKSEELPKIENALYNYISDLADGKKFSNDSLVMIEKSISISQSFADKTMYIKSTGPIILENITISGNIKIYSSKSVTISKSCTIADALIIAPYIKTEEGFKGNCQLIATDSIIVEKNCIFNYPSVLLISSKKSQSSFLKVNEGTEINGDIVALKQYPDLKNITFVSTEQDVVLTGRIYCQDYLDNKAKTFGSIYTSKLYLNTGSAVYENYINNMKLDNVDIPQHCTLGILFDSKQKSIIKCLP